MTASPSRAAGVSSVLKPFLRPWRWVAAWLLAVAVVVAGSLIPTRGLPPVPAGTDKVEHLVAYALLSAFAVQLFTRRLALGMACGALVLLGLGLEYLQGRMALGRAMDLADAFANAVGVGLGLVTAFTPWRDALLRRSRAGPRA